MKQSIFSGFEFKITSKHKILLFVPFLIFFFSGCTKNKQIPSELWNTVLTKTSPIVSEKGYNGGNESGNLSGGTFMTFEILDNGNIRFNVDNVTGSIYTGYEPWSDAYTLEFDDLWRINKPERKGFGGKIKVSESGTHDVSYNIVIDENEDKRKILRVIFFNTDANWSQWGRWTLDDDAVEAAFLDILEKIDYD
jgi:hypothetical protein